VIVSTISSVQDHALVLYGLGARLLTEEEVNALLDQMRMLAEMPTKQNPN
jgi:hypothetical protein